jgi:hypothetical protein
MLPLGLRELKNLLTSPGTPADARLKAAEETMDLNGIPGPSSCILTGRSWSGSW